MEPDKPQKKSVSRFKHSGSEGQVLEETQIFKKSAIDAIINENKIRISKFCSANNFLMIFRDIPLEAEYQYEDFENRQKARHPKLFATKIKTSPYFPLIAEIVYNVCLSKTKFNSLEEETRYQKKIDLKVKESLERVRETKKLLNSKKSFLEKEEILNNFNNSGYIKKVPKKVCIKDLKTEKVEKYELFFLKDKETKKIQKENNEILFLIKRNNKFFKFKKEGVNEQYILDYNKYELNQVYLLYYYIFKKTEKAKKPYYLEKQSIITDYDEMGSTTARIFPFDDKYRNLEQIRNDLATEFTNDDFDSLYFKMKKIHNGELVNVEEDIFDSVAKLISKYEIKKRKENCIIFSEYFGQQRPTDCAAKTVLRDETKKAINHAGEVHNPFPREFENDKTYIVFLPDSFEVSQDIIKGFKYEEKDVPYGEGAKKFYKIKYIELGGKEMSAEDIKKQLFDFVNIARKMGYPLDVNIKWPIWRDKNTDDLVPVSENDIDWNSIDSELAKLEKKAIDLENSIENLQKKEKGKKKKRKKIIKNSKILKKIKEQGLELDTISNQILYEQKIIKEVLEIRRIILESEIFYFESEKMEPTKKLISEAVQSLEILNRVKLIQEKIKKIEDYKRKLKNIQKKIYLSTIIEKQLPNYLETLEDVVKNFENKANEKLEEIKKSYLKKSEEEKAKRKKEVEEMKEELEETKKKLEEIKKENEDLKRKNKEPEKNSAINSWISFLKKKKTRHNERGL